MGIRAQVGFVDCESGTASANPDPRVYEVVREQKVGNNLVLKVRYPGCTNFEGLKIMVFKGFFTSKALITYNHGVLDPHFSEGLGAPIARFRPDAEGWRMAVAVAKAFK